VWLPPAKVFRADVHVCAAVVVRDRPPAPVEVVDRLGAPPVARVALPPSAPTWSSVVAAAQGVPAVQEPRTTTLGSVAEVRAGFRDEYYDLVDLVQEPARDAASADPRVVTVGSIDVGCHHWGERPQRFARRRWHRPVVERSRFEAAPERVRRWWAALNRPKALVATQTKLLEAVADPTGALVPVTPVVSVLTDPTVLGPEQVVAAICAPSVVALAHQRVAGTGLSPTTLRLRAADVAGLPLPVDDRAWQASVDALAVAAAAGGRSAWRDYARVSLAAHGHPDREDLVEWWLAARTGLTPGRSE
jgi:hypothetical protein